MTGEPNVCSGGLVLGTVASGSSFDTALEYLPNATDESWFRVSFPQNADFREHGTGLPRVRFVTNDSGVFRLDIRSACGTTMVCGNGTSADNRTDWYFQDTCTNANTNCSTRGTPWPTTVYARVYRVATGTGCERFRLRISR